MKCLIAFGFAAVPGLACFALLAVLGVPQFLAGLAGGAVTGLGLDVLRNNR